MMSAADLQQLLGGMAQIAGQRTAPTPRLETTKDLKLAEPRPFSGKTEDLDDFLNECEMIFSVKDDIYNTSRR